MIAAPPQTHMATNVYAAAAAVDNTTTNISRRLFISSCSQFLCTKLFCDFNIISRERKKSLYYNYTHSRIYTTSTLRLHSHTYAVCCASFSLNVCVVVVGLFYFISFVRGCRRRSLYILLCLCECVRGRAAYDVAAITEPQSDIRVTVRRRYF